MSTLTEVFGISKILFGSIAELSAMDIPLPNGVMAIGYGTDGEELDYTQFILKIGDGVNLYDALPAVVDSDNAIKAEWVKYLTDINLPGGTAVLNEDGKLPATLFDGASSITFVDTLADRDELEAHHLHKLVYVAETSAMYVYTDVGYHMRVSFRDAGSAVLELVPPSITARDDNGVLYSPVRRADPAGIAIYKLNTNISNAVWEEDVSLQYTVNRIHNFGFIYCNNALYVVGGRDSTSAGFIIYDSVYKLDLSDVASGWVLTGTLPIPTYYNNAVVSGNKFTIIQGNHYPVDGTNVFLSSLWEYDTITDTITDVSEDVDGYTPITIPGSYFRSVNVDDTVSYYLSTQIYAVYKFDHVNKSITEISYPDTTVNNVSFINGIVHYNGFLYGWSNGGVVVYDIANNTIRRITKPFNVPGMPYYNFFFNDYDKTLNVIKYSAGISRIYSSLPLDSWTKVADYESMDYDFSSYVQEDDPIDSLSDSDNFVKMTVDEKETLPKVLDTNGGYFFGILTPEYFTVDLGDPLWEKVTCLLNFNNGYYDDAAGVNFTAVNQANGYIVYDEELQHNVYKVTGAYGPYIYRNTITGFDHEWGTTDFTYECYLKINTTTTSLRSVFAYGSGPSDYTAIYTGNSSTSSASALSLYSDLPEARTEPMIELDKWYHVATSRNGTSLLVFVDGNLAATRTISANASLPSTYSGIRVCAKYSSSGGFTGNMAVAGVRVTKGVARYTTGFTPPSLPLPTTS